MKYTVKRRNKAPYIDLNVGRNKQKGTQYTSSLLTRNMEYIYIYIYTYSMILASSEEGRTENVDDVDDTKKTRRFGTVVHYVVVWKAWERAASSSTGCCIL
jgi:hypothetical protein